MKLYKAKPTKIIRIDIKGGKNNSKLITVENDNYIAVSEWCYQKLSELSIQATIIPTEKLKSITITTYEAWGDKKGNSKSFSCYGMTGSEIYDYLMSIIEK